MLATQARSYQITEMTFEKAVYDLIKESTSDLPKDVVSKIKELRSTETNERAISALDSIIKNIELSKTRISPICQDTGTLIFEISYPAGISTMQMKKSIVNVIVQTTKDNLLRPNTVDPITGNNPGNNLGKGQPYIHFEEWEDQDHLQIKIMQKGGGCENVGVQYSLPNTELSAGRDVPGIKKCILDAIFNAQGKGCSPGIIGVGIGGDRTQCFMESKHQLFRKLGDTNEDPILADIEEEMFLKGNQLGIGPMGFGGKTTVLGVKVGKIHRLPASFFVSVSYMCWASRRKILTLNLNNGDYDIKD